MIVWSGLGFVAALIFVVALALSAGIVDGAGWGFALAAVIAAAANFGFSTYYLDRREKRVLVDPKTQQQVVLRHNDSLFFIPVKYWTWIFLAFALVLAGNMLLKSETPVSGTTQTAPIE